VAHESERETRLKRQHTYTTGFSSRPGWDARSGRLGLLDGTDGLMVQRAAVTT
jgi:hypothetical protein